jgi:hypothetical protein
MTDVEHRFIVGDWMGSRYGIGGDRSDWLLSLKADGSYSHTICTPSECPKTIEGRWTVNDEESVLSLSQENSTEAERWTIHDVTGLERANTLLVLRYLALASRNLPILLYRVYR